jgi:hypothetical protein
MARRDLLSDRSTGRRQRRSDQARRIAVELSEELDGGDTGWETDLLNRLMGKVWEGLGIEAMGQVRVEHQALLERTGQI